MHMRRLLAAAFAMAFILSACVAPPVPVPPDEAPIACRLIGCGSQVTFELEADVVRGTTYEVEACVDGECASATVDVPDAGFAVSGPFSVDADGDALTLRLLGDDYSGAHEVSLRVTGSDGLVVEAESLVEFDRLQPNGRGCAPVCWQVTVRVA